ncbi:unnamed protein product [Blepharisma stoltei]|uniref:Myb-like domain-containing protein n=1 Tax=Blepharisma stoltei TaxID=1481888 RepID=A0AAU9JVT7_9CILI|nr:unnamed protein product [Blepharisma stoltei]
MNKELRRILSGVPIVDQEGSINHRYFADFPGAYWSQDDENQLLKGIEDFGVGEYEEIAEKYMPNKSPIELKLRTCILLGAYNLDEWNGLKDPKRIGAIKKANEKMGKKSGKWQYGIYINN